MRCKYEHRCEHKKMGLVICHLETGEQTNTCYLYTLIKYIDTKKKKIDDKKRKMSLLQFNQNGL